MSEIPLLTVGYGLDNSEAERRFGAHLMGMTWERYKEMYHMDCKCEYCELTERINGLRTASLTNSGEISRLAEERSKIMCSCEGNDIGDDAYFRVKEIQYQLPHRHDGGRRIWGIEKVRLMATFKDRDTIEELVNRLNAGRMQHRRNQKLADQVRQLIEERDALRRDCADKVSREQVRDAMVSEYCELPRGASMKSMGILGRPVTWWIAKFGNAVLRRLKFDDALPRD